MIQVADLEISNASLMAINRSLESEFLFVMLSKCCGLGTRQSPLLLFC